MLDKPDLADERLLASLAGAYGLRAAHIAFLPLGADINTAVYRVEADGRAYFLKLRRGAAADLSAVLPALLASRGLAAVIPPLPTLKRQWTSELGPYTLALYPFVDGVDGYQGEMSETQWVQLGAALKRLHGVRLPPAIRRALPREDYSPRFRQRVQSFLGRAASRHFDDPLAAELAALLAAQASRVQQLLGAADGLARQLPNRARAQVLCHGDIHHGNVLISGAETLHIVDWDTALLAPQERDLMFIGSGLLGRTGNEAQEAAWFYQGYGAVEVDAAVVAYYRCERVVQDIEAYTAEILAASGPSQDRPQALRYLASQFEPGNVVDNALGSFAAL